MAGFRGTQPRGRGLSTRRLDAGGRRIQAQSSREAMHKEEEQLRVTMTASSERRERIHTARTLGKIPTLSTIEELKTVAERPKPELPAYQLAPDMPKPEIFGAIFNGQQANRVAHREATENLGPHFDHYYEDFEPWILDVNEQGEGKVRACFLEDKLFDSYVKVAAEQDLQDPIMQDLLAAHRTNLTSLQLATGEELLEGELVAGTQTLLWQGQVGRYRPVANSRALWHPKETISPSIHEFDRVAPTDSTTLLGTYSLYAFQNQGEYIPEGFEPI